MFKRFFLSFALVAGPLSPVHGAGTIPFSLSQQFDQFGHPLAGCQFFTIQAGTTSTPQNVFQDSALTLALPNPQTCDAAGRLPQFFAADGSIKVRLTDKNGVVQIVADNVQVIGNSSGGGGGSPVDPTTILQTGDIKAVYGTGVVTGFVRLNGRTIGSASSGASERANADTQALFQYLWGADPNLVVSTGRGVSANADWVANKQITLPDGRDRALAGLGDMGNADAGLLTATYFGATSVGACLATTLGCAGGSESQTLTLAQLPTITSVNTSQTITVGSSSQGIVTAGGVLSSGAPGGSNNQLSGASNTAAIVFSNANSISVTSSNTSGTPHPNVQPLLLITVYMKL